MPACGRGGSLLRTRRPSQTARRDRARQGFEVLENGILDPLEPEPVILGPSFRLTWEAHLMSGVIWGDPNSLDG